MYLCTLIEQKSLSATAWEVSFVKKHYLNEKEDLDTLLRGCHDELNAVSCRNLQLGYYGRFECF